jgi:quercetin 2,3-dioxygenase
MISKELPGTKLPYFLRAGVGEKYLFGGQLATMIAREQDTAGLLEAVILSGGKGSRLPLHRHQKSHESILVLDGKLEFWLDGRSQLLSRGDYASIPAGRIHGYQMQGHYTRLLSWMVNGNAGRLYSVLGEPYAKPVYPPGGDAQIPRERLAKAEASVDVEFISGQSQASLSQGLFAKVPPSGISSFALEAGEGERLIAGSELFTFLAHQGNTDGKFIALTTQGPKGERIPNHFHEKHTETFFCLDGYMTMWADGEELSLLPGDFVHAPAGTVHSFRLDAPYTNFLGVLAPGLFENFFRTLCDPYQDYIFPAEPRAFRFDRVMRSLHELDLKLVEDPRARQEGHS